VDAAIALADATTWAPVGTRFLRRCRELAPARHAVQRELAAWAAHAAPEAAERAILTVIGGFPERVSDLIRRTATAAA